MSNWIAAPMDRKRFEPRNRLLAALPARDLLSLQPHLTAVPLAGGSILSEADEPLDRVYFVDSGVVSLVTAFEDRVTAGVAAVGREGVVGATALLLGGDTALGRSRVLVPGSALALEVPRFRSALRKSLKLRAACEASTRALFVQMLQSVPCSRLHTVEQRCARWLLVCADRTEGDTFELSQECFAEMLGVPKSRSPGVARKLQQRWPDLLPPRRDHGARPPGAGGGRVRMLPDRPQPLRATAGASVRLTAARSRIERREPRPLAIRLPPGLRRVAHRRPCWVVLTDSPQPRQAVRPCVRRSEVAPEVRVGSGPCMDRQRLEAVMGTAAVRLGVRQ